MLRPGFEFCVLSTNPDRAAMSCSNYVRLVDLPKNGEFTALRLIDHEDEGRDDDDDDYCVWEDGKKDLGEEKKKETTKEKKEEENEFV